MQQDISLFATLLEPGESVRHALPPDAHAWVQSVDGQLAVNGVEMTSGDGLAAAHESELELAARSSCEALVFELR